VRTFRALYDEGHVDRDEAIVEMTRRYLAGMRSNEPVHTWDCP
jgi:hypothetical protein